jgi:nucleoside-diphosphate kinase
MPLNYTFTMIKPGAVNHEYIGPILTMINDAGFKIIAMKFIKMREDEAEIFYNEHNGKPFFESLVEFMTSGPLVAMIIEKENAVEDYRKLIGNTDPNEAEDGTIRKLFAKDKSHNAVHGSDSDESAKRESDFFFSVFERYHYETDHNPYPPIVHKKRVFS